MVATGVGAVVTVLGAARATAEPQWNGGLLAGVGGVGDSRGWWRRSAAYGALRGELLVGRSRNVELGVGPYVEVGSVGLADVRPGGGAAWLVPLNEYVPVVFSVGGYGRWGEGADGAGLAGSAFVGAHSHNFHSPYAMVWGVVVGVQRSVVGPDERVVTIAAHLDLLGLALPGLFLYEAVAGPPAEE